jgi:hypothetical protein
VEDFQINRQVGLIELFAREPHPDFSDGEDLDAIEHLSWPFC